jgi:hypothetical protein
MPNLNCSRKDYNRIIGLSLQETLSTPMDSFDDLQILSQLLQEIDPENHFVEIRPQIHGYGCSKQELVLPSKLTDMRVNN